MIYRKDEHEVVLYECFKMIGGSIKHFCIKETKQYFCTEKRAIRAAHDLLLKKTLPKFKYKERQQEKRKRIGADKIIKTFICCKETKAYIHRWDEVLYLETKKNLCEELTDKLGKLCAEYGFENAYAAIEFKKKSKL